MMGVLAVLGLVASVTQVQAAKEFHLKFQKGQVFQVTMNQETKQTIMVMGQNKEMPMNMTMGMTWNVTDVKPDGTIFITQTIDRVQMAMNIPGQGEMKYDSQNPGGGGNPLAAMLGKMFEPMLKAKFEQKMNRQGKMLEIKIPDEALQSVSNNPLLQKFFSKEALEEMMSKMSPVLPDQAIKKGFSWESSVETPAPPFGTMKIKTKYTYEGTEQKNNKTLDKFGLVMAIDMQIKEGAGASLKVQDQKSSGTMYFDSEAGYFVENVITQQMTIAGQSAGQAFTQKLNTVTRLTTAPAKK